jgi:hypothetical protein
VFVIRKLGEPVHFLGIRIIRELKAGTITLIQEDNLEALALAAELGFVTSQGSAVCCTLRSARAQTLRLWFEHLRLTARLPVLIMCKHCWMWCATLAALCQRRDRIWVGVSTGAGVGPRVIQTLQRAWTRGTVQLGVWSQCMEAKCAGGANGSLLPQLRLLCPP